MFKAATVSTKPETPRAVSQKRIDANRRNAKKSTGPRIAAGKAAASSSSNSRKHGMRSNITLLPHEDPVQFEWPCDKFFAALKPRHGVEAKIVGDAAFAGVADGPRRALRLRGPLRTGPRPDPHPRHRVS